MIAEVLTKLIDEFNDDRPFGYSAEWHAGFEAAGRGDSWDSCPDYRKDRNQEAWRDGWKARQFAAVLLTKVRK